MMMLTAVTWSSYLDGRWGRSVPPGPGSPRRESRAGLRTARNSTSCCCSTRSRTPPPTRRRRLVSSGRTTPSRPSPYRFYLALPGQDDLV